MQLSWNDLKTFLDVARAGGLSAAARVTGTSPATLGRHISALESAIGDPLFVRGPTGYHLTPAGEELLEHAAELESGFQSLQTWQKERHGDRVVRISAGHWTAHFLSTHISDLWSPKDRFRLEFVTANHKVDIGRRQADLGLRNNRPTEKWLAGQKLGNTAFALYSGRKFVSGAAEGMFVGLTGNLIAPSARWLEAHHSDRIGIRGNDAATIREMVAAGAGLGVLPCFVGDDDDRLVRVTGLINELGTEQWLVSHQEERHATHVRTMSGRIAKLMRKHADLFAGDRPAAK